MIADPCPTCRGDGRVEAARTVEVKIPAGADTGLRLLMPGEGDAGQPGAERGDLELVVRIAEHPDFQRDGVHLGCAVPVSFSQAALGATIEIPTLTGHAKLVVPPGAQSHTEIRIAGEGMPELRVDRRGQPVANSRRGDLRVLIVVETPTNLNPRQEELLRELAGLETRKLLLRNAASSISSRAGSLQLNKRSIDGTKNMTKETQAAEEKPMPDKEDAPAPNLPSRKRPLFRQLAKTTSQRDDLLRTLADYENSRKRSARATSKSNASSPTSNWRAICCRRWTIWIGPWPRPSKPATKGRCSRASWQRSCRCSTCSNGMASR